MRIQLESTCSLEFAFAQAKWFGTGNGYVHYNGHKYEN